jgi:hypothetical protein
MTKRETILQAIVTLLAGIPGSTGVYRSREEAMTREESPAVIVRPDGEEVAENTIGFIDARLTVVVEVYARGAAPDSVADPVVEVAFARMMAPATPAALHPDVVDIIEEGTSFDAEGADLDAGITSMRFVVWHRRNRTSLAT